MFNRKYLFDLLRNAPFGGALTQAQVLAIGLILDLCERLKLPVEYIAYILATAFHETGGTFKPGRENLNYSVSALISKFSRSRISAADAERYGRKSGQKANQSAIANLIYGGAWGLANLGNKLAGDGWRYIGRGLVQITGRKNYARYGIADDPERATALEMAVHILVDGMVNGVFTGKKLSDFMTPAGFNPEAARAVVNGKDKASLIARHYDSILAALTKAKVDASAMPVTIKAKDAAVEQLRDVSEVKTTDVPAAESPIAKTFYGLGGAGVVASVVGAVANPWGALALVAILVVLSVFAWGHLTGRFEFKREPSV